jgi:hypothetical protein
VKAAKDPTRETHSWNKGSPAGSDVSIFSAVSSSWFVRRADTSPPAYENFTETHGRKIGKSHCQLMIEIFDHLAGTLRSPRG